MNTPDSGRGGKLCALGVAELGQLYRARVVSPVEVVEATLARIERLNPELNAYVTVMADSALASARAAGMQLANDIDLGPLHGVPVSVKDLIRVKGTRTTAASRVLQDAPRDEDDAEVTRRLRASGAILVGKTNLTEFAAGDPDPEGPFRKAQNPRRIGRQTAGSSSGSAAAVAAGLCVVSLGSDSGGSIRHPASVCGIAGLKTTYGRVSGRGVIPLSPYLDTVGPMARSVSDLAAGLAAIAGHDPRDPYSALVPVEDYVGAVGKAINGLRMALPTNPFYEIGEPEVRECQRRARHILVNLGLVPVEIELPRAEETLELNALLISVEAWLYHERHLERKALYGRDFANRFLPARSVSAVKYAQAKEAQAEIRRLWLSLFDRVDVLVLPANVAGAPPHGVDTIEVNGKQMAVRVANSGFNRAANLTGFPALTFPIGETADRMPVGLQLVGPPFGEARLLSVAHALEQALGNPAAKWGIEPRAQGLGESAKGSTSSW